MAPNDALSHAVAAHLQAPTFGAHRQWTRGADYPMLSVARSGMTFEVGPVAWGVIDGALYAQSLRLVKAALDYVHAHNLALEAGGPTAGRRAPSACSATSRRSTTRATATATSARWCTRRCRRRLRRSRPARPPSSASTARPRALCARKAAEAAATGGVLYPFFVNEAAYYEAAPSCWACTRR